MYYFYVVHFLIFGRKIMKTLDKTFKSIIINNVKINLLVRYKTSNGK